MDSETLIKAVSSVMKKWTKQRKAEERGRARSRREAMTRYYRVSIKDAAFAVMEEAYLKASAGGTLPASARQIMYAARPMVLRLTGGDIWKNSSYFTQKLLPDFVEEYPVATEDWDVVYDARGHMAGWGGFSGDNGRYPEQASATASALSGSRSGGSTGRRGGFFRRGRAPSSTRPP